MKLFIFYLIQKISFGRIFWKRKKNIYLTFDDGPDAKGTPVLLEILKKYNAKATFFVVGENVERNMNILKKISAEGHIIANHTYSHIKYKNNLGEFLEDVGRCEALLQTESIQKKKLFRITYGTVSIKLFVALLKRGYRVAFWNKDTKDYKLKDSNNVAEYMDIKSLRDGDIVLMHDYPRVTPYILENILTEHADKNFVSL